MNRKYLLLQGPEVSFDAKKSFYKSEFRHSVYLASHISIFVFEKFQLLKKKIKIKRPYLCHLKNEFYYMVKAQISTIFLSYTVSKV